MGTMKMTRSDSALLRTVPLLLALVAGVVTTQLMPPFRDIAYALNEARESAAASPGNNFSDMTGIDVDLRHLQFAGRLG
jgi:hypothetical protein